jgi:hypothetical protein
MTIAELKKKYKKHRRKMLTYWLALCYAKKS